MMEKERLEWVMSGLTRYKLTKTEDQFIKTAVEDFAKNHAITPHQEERLEALYKEKSKSKPSRNSSDYFSFKEDTPKKTKPRKPHWKAVF